MFILIVIVMSIKYSKINNDKNYVLIYTGQIVDKFKTKYTK